MENITQRLQQISALAPILGCIVKIQATSNDSLRSLKDLATIIQNNPILIANIIKHINSPIYSLKEHINIQLA